MISPRTRAYLEQLIAFPTVSRDSNLALIAFIAESLEGLGLSPRIVPDESGTKANLWVTIGPEQSGGIVLSGHTDVVPVDNQAWSSDPFHLTEQGGRLYGRGTADMKGFIAACLAMAHEAVLRPLAVPLHFAFSYDEEVGCIGVRRLIALLQDAPFRPRFCIVGEPTLMQVVTAHKGKSGARVSCHGLEAHSSLAPLTINAEYMACDLIAAIRAIQDDVLRNGPQDGDYEVACTTLHAGKLCGGSVLNVVSNLCTFEYEIRHLPHDDPAHITARIEAAAAVIVEQARKIAPSARIEFTPGTEYPALDAVPSSDIVQFVQKLTGGNSTGKVTFGTEAGLFSRDLGVPAVVCGPGSISVAHKPDEYVSLEQLAACERFLGRLLDEVSA